MRKNSSQSRTRCTHLLTLDELHVAGERLLGLVGLGLGLGGLLLGSLLGGTSHLCLLCAFVPEEVGRVVTISRTSVQWILSST